MRHMASRLAASLDASATLGIAQCLFARNYRGPGCTGKDPKDGGVHRLEQAHSDEPAAPRLKPLPLCLNAPDVSCGGVRPPTPA